MSFWLVLIFPTKVVKLLGLLMSILIACYIWFIASLWSLDCCNNSNKNNFTFDLFSCCCKEPFIETLRGCGLGMWDGHIILILLIIWHTIFSPLYICIFFSLVAKLIMPMKFESSWLHLCVTYFSIGCNEMLLARCCGSGFWQIPKFQLGIVTRLSTSNFLFSINSWMRFFKVQHLFDRDYRWKWQNSSSLYHIFLTYRVFYPYFRKSNYLMIILIF